MTTAKRVEITKKFREGDVVWFTLSGTDYGTGISFNNSEFGIYDDGTIVDSENCPVGDGYELTAIKNSLDI